jgi:hypothetical protein
MRFPLCFIFESLEAIKKHVPAKAGMPVHPCTGHRL